MGVGEELGRVLLDLSDREADTSVLAVSDDTSAEGSLEAADSVAALLVTDGVREGNTSLELACVSSHASLAIYGDLPRRSGLALGSLVDVSGSVGGRLVVSTEAVEGDVVADDILVGVDAELEETLASLESASELVVGVDNLVRSSMDFPSGSESEGNTAALGLKKAKGALLVLHVRSGRGSSEGAESDGDERELHICGGIKLWKNV